VILHDTHATSIPEKTCYLSNQILLSRNVYNLEGISSAFKNLPDFEGRGQGCMEFRISVESQRLTQRLQIETLANYMK